MSNLFICTNKQVGAQFPREDKPMNDVIINTQETSDTDGVLSVKVSDEQFMIAVKAWLRTMPETKRQETIDELVACTLRTLE